MNERFERMVEQVLNYKPPSKRKKKTKTKAAKKKTKLKKYKSLS